jgi:hypothetical protein
MADKLPDRYYVRVTAKAKIDGTNYPLEEFDVTYALNAVPEARLRIVLGRGMSGADKGKVSSGWKMLETIKPFTPVEISTNLKATPSGRFSASDDGGLKDGQDQVIFKGFLFTPTQVKDRMGGTAALEFSALGYPAALGGSTQFCTGMANAYPDNSGATRIVASTGSSSATLSTIDAFIHAGDPKKVLNAFIIMLFQRVLNLTSTFNRKAANQSAEAELNRMDGNPLGTSDLTLDYGNIKPEYYNRALSRFYAHKFFEPWRNPETGGDLWSILLAIADAALFKIVPAIEHDAMAPITLGLGGKEWRSFEPSDYWAISMGAKPFTQEFYSYVGKVGVCMPEAAYSQVQQTLQIGKTLGYAELNDEFSLPLGGKIAGKLITVPPPEFMICPGPPGAGCGLGGGATPDAAEPKTAYLETNFGKDLNVWVRLKMGNGYANTVLRNKVFQHRLCTIYGRFRLDIAPGSLVKITTIGERFVSESEVFYGHANSVTLRGVPGRMATEVSVIAVRTALEHEKYTVPNHPLYEKRWAGAMLTD